MAQEIERGTRLDDFKSDLDEELKKEVAQVARLKRKVFRASRVLNMEQRFNSVVEIDRYITGIKAAKNARRIYIHYLAPLLEEAHRNVLPEIPAPRVIGRTKAAAESRLTEGGFVGASLADMVRELLDLTFNSPFSMLKSVADDLQYDDDKYSLGVAKTIWFADYDLNDPSPADDETEEAERTRSLEENANPLRAQIANSDVHYIHLQVHREGVDLLEGEDRDALDEHIQEHNAMTLTIQREGPTLERVPPWRYFYDPDVPWHRRTWECEERSLGISEMQMLKWKNLNAQNLQVEEPATRHSRPFHTQIAQPNPTRIAGNSNEAFEDKTARVFDFHDRLTGRRLVFPATPEGRQGLFLHNAEWPFPGVDIYVPYVTRTRRAGELRGIASAEAVLPILDELAGVDFYIQRHVKNHANYKFFVLDKTKSAVKTALNNEDTKFIPTSAEAMALGPKPFAPPPIPDTLLVHRATMISELRRQLGIDAQDVGVSNPHQVSATESFNRATATEGKKNRKQEIMGAFLSRVAKNFLMLYKLFGTQSIMVRTIGPEGAQYHQLNPAHLPLDLDIYLDIEGQSDAAKAANVAAWNQFWQAMLASQLPINMQKALEDYGRALGIKTAGDYRMADAPEVPENAEQAAGAASPPALQFPGGTSQVGQTGAAAPFAFEGASSPAVGG